MDSRGAGYWVCRGCGHHNLRQLSMCVSCDQPASAASPTRVTSTPARPASSPAATPTSTSRHVDSRASPERSRYGDGAASPGTYSPLPPSAAQNVSSGNFSASSPVRSSTYHAQAFVQDLDNKNAVIARLERHVQAMVEQQGRMKRAHEQEIAGIESQMHQAVDAHRMLMHEYRQCASDLSNAKTEVNVAKSEMAALQDKLQDEAKRRVEQAEQHLQEMEQKQRDVRAAKEAAAKAEDSLRAANDEIARLSGRQALSDVASPSGSSPRRDAAASLQLTEMAARNEELAATVERLRYDLEASRSSLDEARERYADDLKRVMREATAANEKAVAGVAAELGKVRESAENAANRDRQYVEHQLKDAQDLATRLQGQLEREGSRYAEKIRDLEQTIKRLQEQRDSMMEESRFSSEIQQDYVKEQTQLKAEISSLRAALRDAEKRRSGSAPPPLSPANSSHGASNVPRQQEAAVAADVEAMNNSVRSAVGGNAASSPTSADDVASRLAAAEAAISQKDVTLATLRGKLETQGAALEAEREKVARANEQVAALQEALEIVQEEATHQPTTAAAANTNAAPNDGPSADEYAQLKEDYENLDSKYMFDTGELRKQVTNLQKKLRDRENDLQEMTEENDQLTEALQELRKAPAAAAAADSSTNAGSTAPGPNANGEGVAALEAQIADLKQSLDLATSARDSKDELLEVKEKEFDTQRQQLMETITRLTDDLKAASADGAQLREELDATNRALEDSEAVCRDALQSLRQEL